MNEVFELEDLTVVITLEGDHTDFVTITFESKYYDQLEVRLSVNDSMTLRHMLERGEKMIESTKK